MKQRTRLIWTIALVAPLIAGCGGGVTALSNSESEDSTDTAAYPNAHGEQATLLSAFYGLDDAIPFLASWRICGSFGHKDGMPVIFSEEIDINTLQAGDFLVTLADGSQLAPGCVTPAPAEDLGEFRTMLMIGDFGSINNQPETVEVVGSIISLNQRINFKGASVDVTPLEAGPAIVHAEIVDQENWELGKEASSLPFGGGTGCPETTRQIVRVVWAGGVTKPGGAEIDDIEREAYRVIVAGDEGHETITPFAIGDLSDGDNNHELCLNKEVDVVRVEFPKGLMTDPREDLNIASSINVTY